MLRLRLQGALTSAHQPRHQRCGYEQPPRLSVMFPATNSPNGQRRPDYVSDNHGVVPTRRGRLLNDSVIEQFFDFVGAVAGMVRGSRHYTCSKLLVTPSEGLFFFFTGGERAA